ncbi:MAG: hypothetical protein ACE5KZ_01315 [Candidatus Scalinduaceae bacterium]
MDNLLKRLIDQLDTLIPFLAISHKDVFKLIQKEKNILLQVSQQSSLPNTYKIYRSQIAHSSLLLGYSYFGAFLADLVRKIYKSNPQMLPKEKQLKFNEILDVKDYNSVLDLMIEKEVIELFYQRAEKIIEYFEKKLKLTWQKEQKLSFVKVSCIRNCIIHSMSKADNRLSEVSKYKVGKKIELDSSDVHSFGITAREFARNLYGLANKKYFQTKKKPKKK